MKPTRPGVKTDSDKEAKKFQRSLISGGMSSKDAILRTREHYPKFMSDVIIEVEEEDTDGGLNKLLLFTCITILICGVIGYMFFDIPLL